MFINESHRGKGIGQQIIEKIMQYAEKNKLKKHRSNHK
ncbi:GNAT family N-acetyltransferase [Flavobacterium sp. Root420]